MLTAADVNAALDRAEKEAESTPEMPWRIVKSTLVGAFDEMNKLNAQLAETQATLKKLWNATARLAERWKEMMAAGAETAAAPASPSPTDAPTAAAPTERVGADGEPLSPDQAAIEAEMDAAVGAAPPTQAPARAVSASAPARGKPRPRPTAAPAASPAPAEPTGAPGSSERQAQVEALMNEAAGPRQ